MIYLERKDNVAGPVTKSSSSTPFNDGSKQTSFITKSESRPTKMSTSPQTSYTLGTDQIYIIHYIV